MTLKTLKDIIEEQSGGARVYPMIKESKIPNADDKIYLDAIGVIDRRIRVEAKKWAKALNEALKKACEKQEDVYNDAKLEIDGVIYKACAYEDDEARPIIKFINQFFNLEGENK